jgi:hypothetical protein
MEDDDNEGEKILTVEDFRKRAMEKLEVTELYLILVEKIIKYK